MDESSRLDRLLKTFVVSEGWNVAVDLWCIVIYCGVVGFSSRQIGGLQSITAIQPTGYVVRLNSKLGFL